MEIHKIHLNIRKEAFLLSGWIHTGIGWEETYLGSIIADTQSQLNMTLSNFSWPMFWADVLNYMISWGAFQAQLSFVYFVQK